MQANPTETGSLTPARSPGCLSLVFLALVSFWIGIISFFRIGTELLMTSIDLITPASAWAVLPGVQILLLATALLPLAWRWPEAITRAIYRAWVLTLGFLLLNTLNYLLPPTAANGRALLQALVALAYAALLLVRNRRRLNNTTGQASSFFPSLSLPAVFLLAAIFTWPWLVWGALGSLLESALQLFSALSLGFTAAVIQAVSLAPVFSSEYAGQSRGGKFVFYGWSSAGMLLLLASGAAAYSGGSQLLLMLCLPTLGWFYPGSGWQADGRLPNSLRKLLPGTLLFGLAAAGPLVWIDPDELALIISSPAGDLFGWALRASVASLAVGLAALIYAGLKTMIAPKDTLPDGRADQRRGRNSAFSTWLAAGAWLVGAGMYAFLGQPGFYGDGLFVILKDQVDLSAIPGLEATLRPRPEERRRLVFQALVAHGESSQKALRSRLDLIGIRYQPFYLVNALQVQGGPLLRFWLENQPEVDRVLDNPWLRPLPAPLPVASGSQASPPDIAWNIQLVQADRVWQELGVRGAGVLIGQADSGVQGDHPELREQYRGQKQGDDYNWLDPWYHTVSPTDLGGHGTHTLGSVLGASVGIAPEATWIGCVNLARNLGSPSLYLDCMQFLFAPYPQQGDAWMDGRPELGADILNNSWGCPPIEGCDAEALLPAVQALRAAGIFVVASAGNDGPRCSSLNAPLAIYDETFTTGAISVSGELAPFSSLGPVQVDGSGRIKPDLLAPGVEVLSSFPNSTYAVLSGTSMAGPHVAGVVALIWSANPALRGEVARTEQILAESASPYTGQLPECPSAAQRPGSAAGFGIVNAYAAVQRALQEK